MIVLAPKTKESAYMKAAEVFKEYYKKVTGISLEITNEIPKNEDMVVIGSEAVQPFIYEYVRGGLGVKFDSDEYCILSKEDKNRTILFLAGEGVQHCTQCTIFLKDAGIVTIFGTGMLLHRKKVSILKDLI